MYLNIINNIRHESKRKNQKTDYLLEQEKNNSEDTSYIVEINTKVSNKYSDINEKYLIKLGSYGLFNRLNILKNLDNKFE